MERGESREGREMEVVGRRGPGSGTKWAGGDTSNQNTTSGVKVRLYDPCGLWRPSVCTSRPKQAGN